MYLRAFFWFLDRSKILEVVKTRSETINDPQSAANIAVHLPAKV